jgi:hypothetical protein
MTLSLLPCPHCGRKHRTITPEECLDRSMTEAKLQTSVMGRAKRRGWAVAHAGKGFVGDKDGGGQFITPMAPGWPDLTLARAGSRLIFMELKRQQGEVSDEQWFWLRLLNMCGARAIIVRPSDLRTGAVTAILDDGDPLEEDNS